MSKFPSDYHQNALLIDIRSPQEFGNGSAPNAINIPLDTIDSYLDRLKGHDQVVVFCRSGNRSSQAKSRLESHGIPNVINGGSWKYVSKNVAR